MFLHGQMFINPILEARISRLEKEAKLARRSRIMCRFEQKKRDYTCSDAKNNHNRAVSKQVARRYVLYYKDKAFMHMSGGKLIDLISQVLYVKVLCDTPMFHLVSTHLKNPKDGRAVDIVGKVSFKLDLTDYWKFQSTLKRLFVTNSKDNFLAAYVLQMAYASLVATAECVTSDDILSCDGMYEFCVLTNLRERLDDISVQVMSFRVLSVTAVE